MTGDAVSRQRTVAIVEAGHGLGREVAVGLAARGYRVYGSAQSQKQIADLEETSGGAVTLTVTDIADRDSVDTWVGAVLVSLGQRRLDVLLTAESVSAPGATLAIINAFLPSLRMARGRIVHFGSTTGRAPVPVREPALEPLGIEVVTLHVDTDGRPEPEVAAADRVIEVVDGAR